MRSPGGRLLLVGALVINLAFAGWVLWTVTRSGGDCTSRYRAASPYYSAGSHPAPAAIFNSADEIIPKSQARRYAAALDQAGVVARVTIVPGSKHAEAYARTLLGPKRVSVIQETADFIKEHE